MEVLNRRKPGNLFPALTFVWISFGYLPKTQFSVKTTLMNDVLELSAIAANIDSSEDPNANPSSIRHGCAISATLSDTPAYVCCFIVGAAQDFQPQRCPPKGSINEDLLSQIQVLRRQYLQDLTHLLLIFLIRDHRMYLGGQYKTAMPARGLV